MRINRQRYMAGWRSIGQVAGGAESQAASGQAAQTGCARLAMDLLRHHAESR